jgi:SH3-like domain-containing protein
VLLIVNIAVAATFMIANGMKLPAVASLEATEMKPAPLKRHARNWRYFDDGTGKPVYLVSSNTCDGRLGFAGLAPRRLGCEQIE